MRALIGYALPPRHSVVVVNDRDVLVTLECIAVNGSFVAKRDALFTIPAQPMGRWRGELPLDTPSKRMLHVDVLTSAGLLPAQHLVSELAYPQ
jgi:hypothetical protein